MTFEYGNPTDRLFYMKLTEKVKTIVFDDQNGICVPDGQMVDKAKEIIDTLMSEEQECITISQCILVDAIRVLAKQGYFDVNRVVFKFNDEIIKFEPGGNLSHWPNGFGDMHDNLLSKLLGW